MNKAIYTDLLPKNAYVKNGIVFDKKTKKCLGTLYEVISLQIKRL